MIFDYSGCAGGQETTIFGPLVPRDDTTGKGLNYRVTVYASDEVERECWKPCRLFAKQTFYRVETPLFFGLLFVKDGKQMKIVAVTDADDD